MKKMINNEVIEMTAEEISQRETQIANDIAEQTTKDNEANAKATAKATAQVSGNTKLLGLGLTQAEATALTGYTPE